MPKQLPIIIGAAVVILIVGLLAFTKFSKTSKPTGETPAVSEQKTGGGESLTKSSVKSLIAAGKSVTCTVDYSNTSAQTKGTVYVSGKQMRGDFTSKGDQMGKDVDSHMIETDNWMYFWSSASNQGTKTKIDPNEPTPTPAAGSQAQSADLNQEANMKCSAWSVDNSKFALPANIQFTDMSQFMKPKASPASGATQGQSPCDSIADPAAKAQCQKAVTGY